MHTKYPHLFQPIKIGNVILKNRIVAAPTGLMDLDNGRLTLNDIAYYELKAQGGCAMVTLGESIIDRETGMSHDNQICLDSNDTMPGLVNTARAIHRHDCMANIELSHGGKYGGIDSIAGSTRMEKTAWGPSEEFYPNGDHVHEMPREIIDMIVTRFGEAAGRCKTAGFDMVMVHAGHGWLFNQFLSPRENHRTDEFGGSLENRARFLMMTLDEVRRVVGKGFPIELRINGDDLIEGAVHLDEYLEVMKMVEDKVDLINVSCGSHEAESLFVRTHPSMFLEHGVNVYLAAAVKKVVKVPVSCVGGINTPELAEEIIASGKADIVEMGRQLVADPFFPIKALRCEENDITPCLRCFNCLGKIVTTTVVGCAVNPIIGQEFDAKYDNRKVTPRKVLVVGGGPGGMEAAIVAAERGHKVILCEASDHLGGNAVFAGEHSFKEDMMRFVKCMAHRVQMNSVDLRLNTRVTREMVEQIHPDVLILAVGAAPLTPPIPGINGKNVFLGVGCDEHAAEMGERVVMLGGGLVGCEAAISLAMAGKKVTIVEMNGALAPDCNQFHKMAMELEFEKYGIEVCLNTKVKEITEQGVACAVEGGDKFIECDSVVNAAGLKPRTDVVTELLGTVPESHVIGDCRKFDMVMGAMAQAYAVARDL